MRADRIGDIARGKVRVFQSYVCRCGRLLGYHSDGTRAVSTDCEIRALQFQVVFDPTAFQVERMEPLHFPLPQINLSPANQLVIPESLMGGLELRDQAPLTELRAALLALPALQANSARSSA